MPGGRMLTNGPAPWYFANTGRFNQEETIKQIWAADR
jgi:hypothetical protein